MTDVSESAQTDTPIGPVTPGDGGAPHTPGDPGAAGRGRDAPIGGDGGSSTARPPLRRSRDDKVIAGVAGGLGRYLGVDPVIIRIAFVVLAVSGGSGLLLYLIGEIAIPEERPGEIPDDAAPGDQHTGSMILGAVLVVVGGLLLAERVLPNLTSLLGPLVLMGLGVAVIVGARR